MSAQWSPGTGPGTGGPTGPGGPVPPRRRTGLWIGLGCLVLGLLLAFVAVGAGVVVLALREDPGPDGPTGPTLTAVSGEGYTLKYPEGWAPGELSEYAADSGQQVVLQSEPRVVGEEALRDQVVVYRFSSGVRAVAECRTQANFLAFDLDDREDPEELDRTELGGLEAAHHRREGTRAEEPAVSHSWCVDVDDDIVQIVATGYGSTELPPEALAIVESITWD